MGVSTNNENQSYFIGIFSDQHRRKIFLSSYPYKIIDICSFSRALCDERFLLYKPSPSYTPSYTTSHLSPLTLHQLYHIHNYSHIVYHIQLSILCNSIHYILYLYIIFYNRESHGKILYSILLYQYYNIVNTCNHIVTIITSMIYNYLNKYNNTDSITKN